MDLFVYDRDLRHERVNEPEIDLRGTSGTSINWGTFEKVNLQEKHEVDTIITIKNVYGHTS